MAFQPPPYFGVYFTPTIHNAKIPANIDPTKVALRKPHIAVITGAGKGLGYHISLAFAQAGCTGLSISSRTKPDLDALTAALRSINPDLEILASICDTQSVDSVSHLANEVSQKWGRVDTVIANAGIISKYIQKSGEAEHHLPIGLEDDDDWNRVLDINVAGSWRIAKAFMPLLKRSTDGPQSLIIVTSLAAHSTDSRLCPIAYNVSKIACNRLVEHVDNDHREKDGVHAYALHPGAVLTPQTQGHTGEAWGPLLSDDPGLAGAFCVWLVKEKREWLSGRYVACNWDVEELEGKRKEIVERDLLKFRMQV
ncbi:hypothetical protein BCR34DRAFT_34565 [Clohesyomyces aquaticus]|uniref:NAD(P)-binding protein n=1 Tax=Clohesyomyces aquaticus TaxID=1231657 RepID=A0A1Y1Z802_9PLEO|nr:hypothetical protein BCR34DRAFT_34565 [Clohesyomyces aquaticus]